MSNIILLLEGIILSSLILFLPLIFYKKEKMNNQIESGFQTLGKTSLKSFSINFFNILIIFIIFDLELIFLFSLVEKMNMMLMILIIIFIFSTLFLEWKMNKIKWINYLLFFSFIVII